MAENEEIKSKRELVGERLKKRYPEKDYSDDEAMFGQINDDYDEYDGKLQGYQEREGKIAELFQKDPRSAQFITEMAQGRDPVAGLVNLIGIDGVKEMLEDPERVEEFAEENRQYVERIARQKDLEEQWTSNMQETLTMLESKQQEQGLSDEQIDEAADWIKSITNDAVLGIIKPETFDMAMKAIRHDADVAEAGTEGEIRGRNQKIEAQLRKPQAGDGTPVLAGANNGPTTKPKRESIFDLADGAR